MGLFINQKQKTRTRTGEGDYRHIEVEDKVDKNKRTRTLIVTCPVEYPGLGPVERRRMYEGLAMIAKAFEDADERIEHEYRTKGR